MELPHALRQAVDAALAGIPLRDLSTAASALSQRYRAELRDGRMHVADDLAARAYCAARLPATYAAVRAALSAIAVVRPEFYPQTLLDFGAGPGTALWAARDNWPDLEAATLIEASNSMRKLGAEFAPLSGVARLDWRTDAPASGQSDLVTLAYVLDELDAAQRTSLVRQLWSLTGDTLLIVEPGTPAGWRRILDARAVLLGEGAHMVAPCPHRRACPLIAPDWCHFSRRVARSRAHLQAKSAEVPWEDEKFSYLAVARFSSPLPQARVVGPPQKGSGKTMLKLCRSNGSVEERLTTRRDGDTFKAARRAAWGDAL